MRDSRRTRTVLGLLLLVSLTLVVLSLRGGGDGARDTANGIFGPVENAASAVVRPIRDFFGSVVVARHQGPADRRPAAPQRRAHQAAQHQRATPAVAPRSSTTCSASPGAGQYTTVPAQVVAFGPDAGLRLDRHDRRRQHRRRQARPERRQRPGPGRPRDPGRHRRTSVVALLVDATSTVGARVENSGEVGFLNGTGDPRVLELQLLDPFAPAQVGDRLVSFGVRGGAYVPGIPLGTITEVAGTPGQLTRVATVDAVRRRHDRSTSSASSSRRRAPTRATPCCRPSRPRAPRPPRAAAGRRRRRADAVAAVSS